MSKPGIYIPLITPLNSDHQVCRSSVGQLLAQSQHTASGYLPCLTSGEGWLLSRQQWRDMMRYTLELAGDKQVIVGIERATTAEVLEYALEAQQAGATAVMLTTPFGAEVDGAQSLDHFKTIQEQTQLDLYIYNESSLSGNDTSFESLLAIASLARVKGIKDSLEQGRNEEQIHALREQGLAYYSGWEQHLASCHVADGSVVSLANLEPALCLLASQLKNEVLQKEINRLSEAYNLFAEDWYRYVKKALKARGVISDERVVGSDKRAAA